MSLKKDFFEKYYSSDIFNLNHDSIIEKPEQRPNRHRNRSTLDDTKEEVFNIQRRKKINRNPEKEIYMNHSCERRRKNYEHIYGSDIFNLKSKSVERRKERQHMPHITNRSTFFEEMKNNEEYVKEFKEYTKEKRGENICDIKAEKNNIDENNLRYNPKKRRIKKKKKKNNIKKY